MNSLKGSLEQTKCMDGGHTIAKMGQSSKAIGKKGCLQSCHDLLFFAFNSYQYLSGRAGKFLTIKDLIK